MKTIILLAILISLTIWYQAESRHTAVRSAAYSHCMDWPWPTGDGSLEHHERVCSIQADAAADNSDIL